MRNVSDKICRGDQNSHFMFNNLFSKIVPFMTKWGKRQNPLLRLHCNNGYTNAPQCYIIRTFPVLLYINFFCLMIETEVVQERSLISESEKKRVGIITLVTYLSHNPLDVTAQKDSYSRGSGFDSCTKKYSEIFSLDFLALIWASP